jgi:hypothetical protein
MSRKLRLAAGLAALSLLTACAQQPVDRIPAPPSVATTPSVTASSTPSPSPTPSAVPASIAPAPVAPATVAPTATVNAAPPQPAECGPDYYRNVDGVCVHRPENADQPPAGATAQCNDGTYSFSQHRSGTCSHHGGVRRWL